MTALNETEPVTVSTLSQRFGGQHILYSEKTDPFMASLLYLGVLTLGDTTPMGKRILTIPNQATCQLYAEQIREILLPPGTQNAVIEIVETLYNQGNMGAVCEFIEQTYFTVLDNRDYRWANELTIKMLFVSLLFNDVYYMMDSEPALGRRYADLLLMLRPDMRHYQLYDLLIECKYVGLSELGLRGDEVQAMERSALAALPVVAQQQTAAHEQLVRYRDMLQTTYGERLKLRCFSVVALGYERLVWDEV